MAIEEHFPAPAFEEYRAPTVGDIDRTVYERLLVQPVDFGDQRLDAMDRAGVERTVLSLSGPRVQGERDTAVARRKAGEVDDPLGCAVAESKRNRMEESAAWPWN
jgi:2,3-dihydroxybenzoate decarboxylase